MQYVNTDYFLIIQQLNDSFNVKSFELLNLTVRSASVFSAKSNQSGSPSYELSALTLMHLFSAVPLYTLSLYIDLSSTY